MPFLQRVTQYVHEVEQRAHNLLHPAPAVHAIIEKAKSTFAPSAQVGAERRQAVFGTTSKIPPIATAATILSAGALTIPSVSAAGGALLANALTHAPSTETGAIVRYLGYSPLGQIAQGNILGAVAGTSGAILGTAGIVETGNIVQALSTGNFRALAPTSFQSGAILGSGFYPAAAHLAALGGFAGRLAKSAFGSAVNTIEQPFQNLPIPEIPHPIDYTRERAADIRDAAKAAFLRAQQGVSSGIQNIESGFGSVLPNINPNISIGGAPDFSPYLLALLGGGALGFLAGRRKKNRRKHRKKYKRGKHR